MDCWKNEKSHIRKEKGIMKKISFGKVFWGILLILGAILMLADQLDWIKTDSFTPFNIIVGIILLGCFINSIIERSFTGMLFSIAFLCILFSDFLHLGKITPWPVLLAAALGSIGLNLIFPKKKVSFVNNTMNTSYVNVEADGQPVYENTESQTVYEDGSIKAEYHEGEVVNIATSFSGSARYIDSPNLKVVNIKCNFGGMEVYFDKAQVPSGTVVVNINASFSGIELYIPQNWNVQSNISTSAAGVDIAKGKGGDGPTIIIQGSITCAGLDIK